MNKFVYDTMTDRGNWSQKRVLIYVCVVFIGFYSTIPIYVPEFDVKEFIVIAFLTIAGFLSYRNQMKNQNEPTGDVCQEETNITTKSTTINPPKDEIIG